MAEIQRVIKDLGEAQQKTEAAQQKTRNLRACQLFGKFSLPTCTVTKKLTKCRILLAIIVGTPVLWLGIMSLDSTRPDILRIDFPHIRKLEFYDPARIHFANEYIFLESIYSPLIELSDDKASPVPGIAREFYWEGSELHLVIRKDWKTVDGYKVNVDDVIFSLKRLILLSENTHGDFKNLICPDVELRTMEQDCPGMVKKGGDTLILKLRQRRDFIIPMLASIDFAILPKRSVKSPTLKIIDYRNTSGPYYVEESGDEGEEIVLRANPHHFHFRPKMAKKVVLVPHQGMNRKQVLDRYNQGEIDHITTVRGLTVDDTDSIDVGSRFHQTIPIQTEIAYITQQGRERLSLERRLAFAKSLQKSFHDYCRNKKGCQTIRQFFLPLLNQGLSREEERFLDDTLKTVPMDKTGVGIRLGLFKSKQRGLDEYTKISKKYMPEVNVERVEAIPAFARLAEEEVPDYILLVTDSGFLEDIGLLSYSINAGFFGLSRKEGRAWLKDYMSLQDKKERLGKLKQMHLMSLAEGLMIPLFSEPYIAVVRKPWRIRFSELFANNPFWKIELD